MPADQNPGKDTPRGFAGLSALASCVSVVPPPPPPKPKGAPEPEPPPRATDSGTAGESPAPTYQVPPQATPSSSKWLWGAGLIIAVIWFASQSDNKPSTRTTQNPSPLAQTNRAPQPEYEVTEASPPVGKDVVLNVAQIQYCLAEDVRLEAAKGALNNYINADVDRFNEMVNDYNARCSAFRYQQRSMDTARNYIVRHRPELEAEGRQRFLRSGSSNLFDDLISKPALPAPDPRVQKIQSGLNRLGYSAGEADGFIGAKTRSAIMAFQRDAGLAEDGRPTNALLQRLNTAGVRPASVGALRPSAVPRPAAPSRDRENYQTCISGEYRNLCKHNLLTGTEVSEVAEAERRANLRTCSTGEYPNLCKHDLLTRTEAADVGQAERRANLRTCSTGEYPNLCKHELLTTEEASQVAGAERRANYKTCISGDYPNLCKHSLLTVTEAAQVNAAELSANLRTCLTGQYPNLCKHALLTPDEAREVVEAERRERRR